MQKASTVSPRSRFEQVETPPLNTDKPSEDRISLWEAQLIDVGYIIIPNALPHSWRLSISENVSPGLNPPSATVQTHWCGCLKKGWIL